MNFQETVFCRILAKVKFGIRLFFFVMLIGQNILGSNNPGLRSNMWQGARLAWPSPTVQSAPKAPLTRELTQKDRDALEKCFDEGSEDEFISILSGLPQLPQAELNNWWFKWVEAWGGAQIIQFLSGAAVNEKDKDGKTALMYAAMGVRLEMVELLLQAGAAVNEKDNDGKTALMYAAMGGPLEKVELLLQAKAAVNEKDNLGKTALMYAAMGVRLEKVELLLQAKAAVNEKDNDGKTALMYAAMGGPLEKVELLLQAKAAVNEKDNLGKTALMYAAMGGRLKMVELLLQAGAAVNEKDNDGKTALMYAAMGGHLKVIELLLQAKAAVNEKYNDGKTALMYAAMGGRLKMVELLLQAKAAVNKKDNDGKTALMYAAMGGHLKVIELLLQAGADVNKKDNDGKTAIDFAFELEDLGNLGKFLLHYRALKFIPINKHFDQEPKPGDYITTEEIPAGTSGQEVLSRLKQDDNQLDNQIAAFQKDHLDYWRNKVQEAYKIFLDNRLYSLHGLFSDSQPLRKLFTQEIYARRGLLPEIMTLFNSRDDFIEILEMLKQGATEQEIERLQKMIDSEKFVIKNVAASKIQKAFKKYKNRQSLDQLNQESAQLNNE